MAAQKQDDQHERTFSSYVRIQVVVLKTCLGRWMIGRSGERGSGISVLPARYDDDDDIKFSKKLSCYEYSAYLYITDVILYNIRVTPNSPANIENSCIQIVIKIFFFLIEIDSTCNCLFGEGQYYWTHIWEGKGAHTIPKGISMELNVKMQLLFDLTIILQSST